MHKFKKALLNAVFLLALVSLTIHFTLKDQNFYDIIEAIRGANDWWLVLAIFFVFLFICGESFIMKYLFNCLGTSIRLMRCIKYSFIGFFFSCVTPSATGGQPMQVFYLSKDDYKISESCLVLMIITIGYKAALVVMSAVLFLFQGSFILDHLDSVVYILIYGVIVNVLFITFLFILIFHEDLTKSLLGGLVNILGHFHIVKNKDAFFQKVMVHMEPYREGATYLKSNLHVFFHVLWMSILQRASLFLVTWCVYRSFGLRGISMIQVLALQTIISLSVDMLPLPGGVGASEKSFTILFSTIFSADLLIPGMILSRGISYYFLVIVTGIVTIITHFRMIFKQRRKAC